MIIDTVQSDKLVFADKLVIAHSPYIGWLLRLFRYLRLKIIASVGSWRRCSA